MRIVVSGTHAVGKSTLIGDFVAAHPGFAVLGDPFDDVGDEDDPAGPASFLRQLRFSAERLLDPAVPVDLLAERGPLDFAAYLEALDLLGRSPLDPDLRERLRSATERALARVDLLVLLPLATVGDAHVPGDEDRELRVAMDDALTDLVDEWEIVAVELPGERGARLRELSRYATGSPGA